VGMIGQARDLPAKELRALTLSTTTTTTTTTTTRALQ